MQNVCQVCRETYAKNDYINSVTKYVQRTLENINVNCLKVYNYKTYLVI
jgi:hypothetical protein